MSSNKDHTISLQNYEEWLILYMDNELSSEEKTQVENFLLLHPHVQEELDLLLSTKLPEEIVPFQGKEELEAAAMKLNVVDEALLLYIDNELPAAAKKTVEEKLVADKDYQSQFALLQQTKLDASETIPYPVKKELYRHTEKVALFPIWMRIAVAVVLILFATLFYVLNTSKPVVPDYAKTITKPSEQIISPNSAVPSINQHNETASVKTTVQTPSTVKHEPKAAPILVAKKETKELALPVKKEIEPSLAVHLPEAVHVEAARRTEQQSITVNKLVATPSVTSVTPASYNNQNNPEEITAGMEGDFKIKRTSAKGLLRKVSRFLEKRTGIGTVNADNELLVGAVALKLN